MGLVSSSKYAISTARRGRLETGSAVCGLRLGSKQRDHCHIITDELPSPPRRVCRGNGKLRRRPRRRQRRRRRCCRTDWRSCGRANSAFTECEWQSKSDKKAVRWAIPYARTSVQTKAHNRCYDSSNTRGQEEGQETTIRTGASTGTFRQHSGRRPNGGGRLPAEDTDERWPKAVVTGGA